MAGNTLHLLLILLAIPFSHIIITLNAIPTSRTGSLFHHSQDINIASKNTHQMIMEDSMLSNGGRQLEHDDYSESGANGRHTPKPPPPSG